jgi:putative ABC transport system ATP-binding protein
MSEPTHIKPIIQLVDVYKEYTVGNISTMALKGASFQIFKGQLIAIMGPSGSGKTTLLNMIGLLDRPTKGHIFFDGFDVSKFNDKTLANLRNTKLGFVFQTFNLINRLSVFENIELPLIPKGIPRRVRAEMVREALAKAGGDESWLRKKTKSAFWRATTAGGNCKSYCWKTRCHIGRRANWQFGQSLS